MSREKKKLPEDSFEIELAADDAAALDEKIAVNEDVEPAEETVDDNTLAETLRADIRLYEEKELVITEKLSLAKDKGLTPQADRCRELLQLLVAEKQKKQAELKIVEERIREAEAKRFLEEFSDEIDSLTDHIKNDVLNLEDELPEPPSFEPMYDHLAKSKRLSVISKAFAWVGIFTGLIGALAYMLLVEFAFFKFRWLDLAIFGGIAVVFVIIALCVGGASNRQKRIAAEVAEEIAQKQAEYEAELERIAEEKNAIWKNERVDAVTEAYKLEKAGDARRARKKALQRMIPDLSKPEELKKTLHKAAPIAAACAAVAAIALVSAGKKSVAKKKSAILRKEFFNWLT